ncbi:MAG: MlaE family ABC transporter permease [Longimicrobiales bacterium]
MIATRGKGDGAGVLEHVGRGALLFVAITAALRHPGVWARPALAELHRQAFDSLALVLVLTGLGGALISQQTGYQFQGNLPSWVVGSVVAASLITEVTPLFTGIALVGIVGTRIAAELGAMKVTEQIDALEVMGRDPVSYLVVPRVVASFLIGPLLVSLALAGSMLAGWALALLTTRADSADFWFGVRHYMRDFPMFFALIKGAAFSTAVTFVSCYSGLEATGGSMGVGRSTRQAVVAMIASIVILDTALVPLLKLVRI